MVSQAQMGEPETLQGKVLGGRYRLEHQLGEGGFGTIWRAEQLVLGATVAIKLIDLAIARQAGALERFLREAQAAAALRSPHVVQVLDYGVDGDQPFIAMELLEGETLAQRLHRLGRLAPSEALRIVTHVARAMTRAHESGIVHRDLKPDNVFLVHNEDEEVTKVLDFGVAKIKNPDWMEESTQTRTGSLIGTPHYMSPEQVQGNKAVDYRSDLWSLGVIAFEMFTGQRPFVGNALGDLVLQICVREMPVPSRLAPVPAGFDDWFAKAAERDPERRFQSARDLAAALRELVGSGERDIELVVAEDMDALRLLGSGDEANTSNQAPSQLPGNAPSRTPARTSVPSETGATGSPIEFAKTMRGDTVQARTSDDLPLIESLPSLHSANRRERGLGRIVFVAMAALLVLLVSIAVVLRNKSHGPARTLETAPTAATLVESAPTGSPERGPHDPGTESSAARQPLEPTADHEAAGSAVGDRVTARQQVQKRQPLAAVKPRVRTKSRSAASAQVPEPVKSSEPESNGTGEPRATPSSSTAGSSNPDPTRPGESPSPQPPAEVPSLVPSGE